MTRPGCFAGRNTRDVIGIVCRVPHEPCEVFVARDADGRAVPMACPVESDLDDRGVCRCGCGFVRGVS